MVKTMQNFDQKTITNLKTVIDASREKETKRLCDAYWLLPKDAREAVCCMVEEYLALFAEEGGDSVVFFGQSR